ncbi:MAG: GGDEF domain-containing protein [Hyphomicrobiales bacterium]|nr:GGDEF domain-containing protein [Hyphomicrobiales bacterium]
MTDGKGSIGFAGTTVASLDINTLFLVTIYVEAILGLLLLFAWVQNSQITAVAWWGFAHLLRAGSIALFGLWGSITDAVSIDLANALLFLSFAVTWTGARVFDGRPIIPMYLVAGPVAWLIVVHLPSFSGDLEFRYLLATGIITTYTWLTALEFWRGRAEPLVSRWPAIFMLFAHGALFLLRTPLATALPWSPMSQIYDSVWLTVLSFEALLFTIAIAFILLAMAKERTEYRQRTAAMVDPLTGIANRRAFMQEANGLIKGSPGDTRPAAVLLIDLDHFKSVNDRFGHAIGDRVLQVFAETARASIRSTDLVGRLGGEEFAAVLPNAGRDKAAELAERIRSAFATIAVDIDGRPVSATVSIGLAVGDEEATDIRDLLGLADQALYCAKERGRNRVEVATLDLIPRRDDEPSAADLKRLPQPPQAPLAASNRKAALAS